MVAKWNWSPCLQAKSIFHTVQVNLVFTHILKTLQWLWKRAWGTSPLLASSISFLNNSFSIAGDVRLGKGALTACGEALFPGVAAPQGCSQLCSIHPLRVVRSRGWAMCLLRGNRSAGSGGAQWGPNTSRAQSSSPRPLGSLRPLPPASWGHA